MGKNILVATLGESPIVVTSMVKALKEEAKVSIDQVDVIYPGDEGIDLGYDIIADHLRKQGICVEQHLLPFPDTNSRETSMTFLQILSGLIEVHERAGNHVYLSLAGGRKNMSALMAVTCQFFECIRGLYHILDRYEDDSNKRNFHSIEALWDFGEEERNKRLNSPVDALILVKIPYPLLASSVVLRQYFSESQDQTHPPTHIEIEGEIDTFYREIFQKKKGELLDVWLSEKALKFYKDHHGNTSKNFEKLLSFNTKSSKLKESYSRIFK